MTIQYLDPEREFVNMISEVAHGFCTCACELKSQSPMYRDVPKPCSEEAVCVRLLRIDLHPLRLHVYK